MMKDLWQGWKTGDRSAGANGGREETLSGVVERRELSSELPHSGLVQQILSCMEGCQKHISWTKGVKEGEGRALAPAFPPAGLQRGRFGIAASRPQERGVVRPGGGG